MRYSVLRIPDAPDSNTIATNFSSFRGTSRLRLPKKGFIIPKMGTVKTQLSETLFSKTQRRVFGLLFGNPQRSYYANEIMRCVQAGIGTVQRELERLAAAGLLTVSRIGNQKHYQANSSSPIFGELTAIVHKTIEPVYSPYSSEPPPLTAHEASASYKVKPDSKIPHAPKRRLAAFCRRHYIRRLRGYWPLVRGDVTFASGIGVLAEFKRGKEPVWLKLRDLEKELEALFGKRVGIVTPTAFDKSFHQKEIATDLETLYSE